MTLKLGRGVIVLRLEFGLIAPEAAGGRRLTRPRLDDRDDWPAAAGGVEVWSADQDIIDIETMKSFRLGFTASNS